MFPFLRLNLFWIVINCQPLMEVREFIYSPCLTPPLPMLHADTSSYSLNCPVISSHVLYTVIRLTAYLTSKYSCKKFAFQIFLYSSN